MFWFELIEKVKFIWQAKNAHGLHSPYVFSFYNSIKENVKSLKFPSPEINNFSKKDGRIILAIIHNLKPATTLVVSAGEQAAQDWTTGLLTDSKICFSKNLSELPNKPAKFDLIILHSSLLISQEEPEKYMPSLISNNSAVIIPHIHASKQAIKQWERLIKEDYVRVSMDLFFIGILFFRKESTKQDFRLRF